MARSEATVEELVGMIERGELRLPEMQRQYVWKAPRIRDLLDSLYRDYPSGAILLWETEEDVPLQAFAIEQQNSPYSSLRLLLDGQQRLTSLSAVIRGEPLTVRGRKTPVEILFNLDHPDEIIVTEVNEQSADDEVADNETDASTAELQRRINRMTFVVGTRQIESLPQWVRVSEVFRTNEDAPFLTAAGIENFADPRYTKYSQRLAKLRGIRKYMYRMDVLPRTMRYEEVTEIFVRVNSLGAKLRSSDLALAQITSKWKGSLKVFDDFTEQCHLAAMGFDRSIHLRNMVAFATGQCRFQAVGRLSEQALRKSWDDSKRGMEFAMNFVRTNAGIESSALLASPSILVAVAYFCSAHDYQLSADDSAGLRRWILLANAKGRYSRGSSETLLDQDLALIREGLGPEDLIDRLRLQVGRLDITPLEMRGLGAGSSLFKTMYLAFKQAGARDWFSDLMISLDHSGAQDSLQFHHIFPRSLLKGTHATRTIDDIANLAFIAGRSNRKIHNQDPGIYLPELIARGGLVALETQCVPTDESLFNLSKYEEFLTIRRETLADRLNQFLQVDGPSQTASGSDPFARDLNDQIEQIELALREQVGAALPNGLDDLPGHVADKLQTHARNAIRKCPSARDELNTLAGRLKYSDFRDLQDIITSKPLWGYFEPTFGSKEILNIRCGQLAEMRNAIRHSRSLTGIILREGEAACMWFRQTLGLQ